MLTLGLVTDIHFGPKAYHDGKLRKLSHLAPELTEQLARRMRHEIRPDLLINLGDLIEDEGPQQDLQRYQHGVSLLGRAGAELVNVAGNHDLINLQPSQLRQAWAISGPGPLYHSFERGGVHFCVLQTHERKDLDVTIDEEQLLWLSADLAATALPVIVLMHHSAAEQDLRGNRWFEGACHICLVRERADLRAVLEQHGRVVAVFNGHLHWNHLDVINAIPYITLQSLTENIAEDEPAAPATAMAVAHICESRLAITVDGVEPIRYQLEL